MLKIHSILPSIICSTLLFSVAAHGALLALTDEDLGNTRGQAFIKIENFNASEHPDYNAALDNDYNFTRVQFGLDLKMLLNIDKVELGRYERSDDLVGDPKDSDILFYNFALGHIDENDNIVPFEMRDPFLEFAYDESRGTKDIVGFRLGFGDSRGTLSNDIQHITGNIDIKIRDSELLVRGIALDGDVGGDAQLLAGGVHGGLPDDIRADTIGIAKGDQLTFHPGGGLGALLGLLNNPVPLVSGGSSPCEFAAQTRSGAFINLGLSSCFELSKYRSVPVGLKVGDDPKGKEFDFAPGLFVSFQTVNDLRWGAPDEELRDTVKGAFFNVPSGSVEVTFEQADEGISRSRTEFISREISIDGVVITDPEGNPISNPRWGVETHYIPAP